MNRMLVTAELAELLRYENGPNSAFYDCLRRLGITHIPGRPGVYDPALVRRRLDESQGLVDAGLPELPMTSARGERALQRWRARRGEAD